ncbi:hypothetical protein [Lysinibacillus sp. FSL K6-0102]|uniref:hypothetical protein n=1 Tax=Lysinibacillus sp. FSL K6-0102 TaxID=2975290 RepID=UPI0030F69A30
MLKYIQEYGILGGVFMQFRKRSLFLILFTSLLLVSCGKEEVVETEINEESKIETTKKNVAEVNEEVPVNKEVKDELPNNDLSAEVDVILYDFVGDLTKFNELVSNYISDSTLEDYQKKELLDKGSALNDKLSEINIVPTSKGEEDVVYLLGELKKYQDIRFQAIEYYIDQENDHDFSIIKAQSEIIYDITLKLIDIAMVGSE